MRLLLTTLTRASHRPPSWWAPDQLRADWEPALNTLNLLPNLRALVEAWLGIGYARPQSPEELRVMPCCVVPGKHEWLVRMIAWCLLDPDAARQVVNPCVFKIKL
jgi:hypothetical protein